MTSRDANMILLQTYAAIPTYEKFWQEGLVPQECQELFKMAKSRADVKDYTRVAPVLASLSQELLLAQKHLTERAVKDALHDAQNKISVLYAH
jgi:hypothetical protein